MKLLKALFLATAMIAMTTACNSNDDVIDNGGLYNSLVTYEGTLKSETGDIQKDVASFTFYTTDLTNPIYYSATGMTRKIDAEAGQRMIISYYLGNGMSYGQSGQISLYTYRNVPGGPVEIKTAAEAEAANAPMTVTNINRTGNYINLFARLMNNPDRTFTMIADETTVGTATVDLYVTTATPSTGNTGTISEQIASFDITSIWRNPSTTAIRVHINNTSGQKVFDFTK